MRWTSTKQSVEENMARTSAPGAHPGYLRLIWSATAALILLAGLSGCGGESPAALPPTAQAPAQETPQTTVLPTPTTAEELRSDRDRAASPPGHQGGPERNGAGEQ